MHAAVLFVILMAMAAAPRAEASGQRSDASRGVLADQAPIAAGGQAQMAAGGQAQMVAGGQAQMAAGGQAQIGAGGRSYLVIIAGSGGDDAHRGAFHQWAVKMVDSAQERLDFWIMLKSMAGVDQEADAEDIESKVRADVVQKLTTNLLRLMARDGIGAGDLPPLATASGGLATIGAATPAANGDYMAPWIDSDKCTACDECTTINSKIFVYNDKKQAIIKDAKGGPYRDLVRSAETCTAQVIHPGRPANKSEKDIDKWIARGEKHN